jgi:hypothetical protein
VGGGRHMHQLDGQRATAAVTQLPYLYPTFPLLEQSLNYSEPWQQSCAGADRSKQNLDTIHMNEFSSVNAPRCSCSRWDCRAIPRESVIGVGLGFLGALISPQRFSPSFSPIPWSRVRLQKLIVSQLDSQFPKVHYSVHKSPPLALILRESNPVHVVTVYLRASLILSSHLRLSLPSGLFPSGVQTKRYISRLLHACYIHRPFRLPLFHCPINLWWRMQTNSYRLLLRSSF